MADDPFTLVTRRTQEVITPDELRVLLQKPTRRAYIGFEPSGAAHIGYAILAHKIVDLQNAGFHVSILLADWHAYINDKLGGSLENIQACGAYMEDMFEALGVKPEVEYVYASQYIGDPKYWESVIRLGKASTLSRVKRAMAIMGRKEEDAELDYIKTLYPVMQVADIFYNKWDLAFGGMDQRHAHMLARDAADKLGWWKPVAIHTPLLPGLKEDSGRMDPAEIKMSKSKPGSGIFLHDTVEEVDAKLKDAFCPAKVVAGNPVLALLEHVVFPEFGEFTVDRPEKFGGPLHFASYEEVAAAFAEGLHPLDLKKATATYVNRSLEKVHAHFEKKPENLERVRAIHASLS